MIRRSIGIFTAAAVFFGIPATAQPGGPVPYDGHSVVRALLTGQADLDAMSAIGARLWGEAVGIGPVDYVASPTQRAAMQAAGIAFDVVIDDVQPLIDAERERLAAGGVAGGNWFLDFKDYDAINTRLGELAQQRPDLASTFVVGQSLEEREIRGIRITGPGADKPAVLINSCQHAREWISPMVTMYAAERLITDYDTDAQVQALVDAVEFLIVPMVNPDGYVWTWGPDRLWRKNRRNNGDGTFGVDLNRNWDFGWGLDSGSSPDTSDETYRGPSAFSEPETQVMRDYIAAHPQIVAHIDFHSYGQLVLWPWGYTSSLPPDVVVLDDIGAVMAAAILSAHGETYVNQQGIDLYPASGVIIDWTYGDQGIFSYTIELRSDGPDPGFLLPPDQIIPTAEENFPAILDIAEFATTPMLYSFPSGLPDLVEAQTPTAVLVLISAISAGLDPGSARLLWRIGTSGAFAESPLTELGGASFEATLPAVPCGDVVQYYFEAQTVLGDVERSPQDAPASFYEAQSFEISVAFLDDFEADLGWIVDNVGLTDGPWGRGVPVDCNRGDPPADADGSGTCYLTDSNPFNCNSDVDGGTTILSSPALDASDPEAHLSYDRWYSNTEGDNPAADVFVVEVSDNLGATWVLLETVGPAGPEVSGGWIHKDFRVADIPGLTNTSLFRIRFTASDLGLGSIVEAAVDHVMVRSLFCTSTCPEDLDGSGDVGVTDLLTLLGAWGTDPGGPPDFDGSGAVDVIDLLALLGAWGGCG